MPNACAPGPRRVGQARRETLRNVNRILFIFALSVEDVVNRLPTSHSPFGLDESKWRAEKVRRRGLATLAADLLVLSLLVSFRHIPLPPQTHVGGWRLALILPVQWRVLLTLGN